MAPVTETHPFTAAGFNAYLTEKKLMATRCTACCDLSLPPRALCPRCYSDAMEWVEMSGRGKLAAYTAIYVGSTFMNAQGFGRDNPYLTGIVALEEGVMISALLLGLDPKHPESVRIGTPLTVDYVEQVQGGTHRIALAFRA